MDQKKKEIAKLVEEQRVKHIQLWFTDVLGNLKMVEIPEVQLPSVLKGGTPFDGSSISGYAEVEESDIVAMPDWDTFRILPWSSEDEKTGYVFCDILDRDFTPFKGDPRWILKRQLERAREMGLEFYVGPEVEFWYFKSSTAPELVDKGGYFDVLPDDLGNDLRKQTMSVLGKLSIPMEASHHEVAPSQHEIDLRYGLALEMADRIMVTRMVVREVAAQNGVHATFMSKPLSGNAASAFHVHQSLFRGSQNAFFSADDPDHLSAIARGFIGGQLRHVRAMTAVFNQDVNSYKRLVPGYEAPTSLSWGHRNRTALIRVPLYIEGQESSLRAELRSPGSTANPYLTFALMLSAGLDGIEQGYDLPAPTEANIYKMTDEEKVAAGITSLPDNLFEATMAAKESELVRNTLGDHVFERFINNKLREWADYQAYVSDFEIQRYL